MEYEKNAPEEHSESRESHFEEKTNENLSQEEKDDLTPNSEAETDSEKKPEDIEVNSEDVTTRPDATLGERRIGVRFEPGNNDAAQNIAEFFAHGINRLEALKSYRFPGEGPTADPEKLRALATAQTKIQEAAQWTRDALDL